MFDFYDLVLFSFLLIPIGQELKLSAGQEAVLLGAALGASGVGGILFGYLSDLYGRKRTLMWTICLYSLGTGLTAFATGPVTLFLFRGITGLGVGGEWAIGHALLAESSPKHFRGRGAALLQIGEPLGVALAAVIGLLVAPIVGWRIVFLLSSASACSRLWPVIICLNPLSGSGSERTNSRRSRSASSFRSSACGASFSRVGCWECSSWAPIGRATSGYRSFYRTRCSSRSDARHYGS